MAGTALAPLLSNLYLKELDDMAAGLGAPYARYSDDIVVLVPPGTYWMGSPEGEQGRNPWEVDFDAEAAHRVSVRRPFYLGKHGPFTERVPLTNFDPYAITQCILKLRAELQSLPT